MASYEKGKYTVCEWVKEHFPKGSTALDVGACDGDWQQRLGDWLVMDAVEIFEPYLERYQLRDKYRDVYVCDMADFEYEHYDLIIFGDVIEHMDVDKARKVLEYAKTRCKDMVVSVPYEYFQEPYNGNKWEAHIQDDLTDELFNSRYPGFEHLVWFWDYCYYHKAKEAL